MKHLIGLSFMLLGSSGFAAETPAATFENPAPKAKVRPRSYQLDNTP